MRPSLSAALTAALVLVTAGACLCVESVEIGAEGGPSVEKTATSKTLALVIPERLFRPKGETAFSTPYIAELHYRREPEKTWQSYGLFKDLDKPLEFTAESEGLYEFFVTLLDQRGAPDITPDDSSDPQVTVLFDWTAPEVTLEAPVGGEIIGAASPFKIAWNASDEFLAEKPVTIEYSPDLGSTWRPIAEAVEDSGSFDWRPEVPFEGRALVRVTARDEAGHAASAVSASPVLIDTRVPEAVLTGPSIAATEDVILDVTAADAHGSGLDRIELWSSLDNGASWSPAGTTAASLPVVFRSTSGRYGLSVRAVDKAGNAPPRPAPGEAPQLVLTIDTHTPLVRLKTLMSGGNIKGDSTLPIEWEAVAPRPKQGGISVYLSPDGGNSWQTVAADVANTGTFLWDVPRINSLNCVLKIAYRDATGAVGADQSVKPFTVDSTGPTSAIGIAPSALDQPLGDLGAVIRPVRPAGQVPESKAGPESAPEVPEPERAVGEKPSEASPPKAPDEVPYIPEPTEPPSQPWTGEKEEPYAGVPGEDATFEELMKAGLLAYNSDQLSIAKDFYRRAATMRPSDGRPHMWLGRIYAKESGFNFTSRKQSFEAAVYEFEKALELSGDDPDIYNDMGYVLLESKRFKDAEGAFAKATELGGKPVYWYNLALALYKQNRLAEAVDACSKALEADGDMAQASFMMGLMSSQQGDWENAATYWRKAVDGYGPDSDYGKLALSHLQQARERLGEVEPAPKNSSTRQKLDRIR